MIRMIKSKRRKWARCRTRMVGKRNACRVLVGKPDGKRLHGEPRRRCEFDIKTDLEEAGRKVVDWIYLAEGRHQWRILVNIVMNLSGFINPGILRKKLLKY